MSCWSKVYLYLKLRNGDPLDVGGCLMGLIANFVKNKINFDGGGYTFSPPSLDYYGLVKNLGGG